MDLLLTLLVVGLAAAALARRAVRAFAPQAGGCGCAGGRRGGCPATDALARRLEGVRTLNRR